MDEHFKANANTVITERFGFLTARFRTENAKNKAFFEKLETARQQLLSMVSGDVLKRLENYVELLDIYSETEGKHIYAQGIKDCIRLCRFLDTDFIYADCDYPLSEDEMPTMDREDTSC